MDKLANLDPQWCWSPFEPSGDRPWTHAMAAHLYRRAGFGADSATLDQAILSTPSEMVARLVSQNVEPSEFRTTADTLAKTILASGDAKQLSAAWLYRLLYTPNQLLEKTVVFWHGHFATSAAKVTNPQLMWAQNQLLREHALAKFEPMVQAIAQDPAMLIYLDSVTNRKAHPNENFARELMELFCLGEGNYTEADVQQLARCFTGWEIKNNKFRKNRYQQDTGRKTVLGQSGNFDGEDGVRIVLEQPAAPLFICRKLYRFFVADEPTPPDALLQPLVDTLRGSDLAIAPVVQQLLSSNLFFSEHAVGRKIRSPVELAIGLLRSLDGTTNTVTLASGLTQIGQGLFFPPNVKGWDGGRAWINSSTLLGRANLVYRVLNAETTKFAGGGLEAYLADRDLKSDAEIVDWLGQLLVAVPLSTDTTSRLTGQLASGGGNRESRLRAVVHALATIPEFQLA